MAFSFKMLNEEGQGDFVLLFAIDWPLVDISEFMYSTGKKKKGLEDGIRHNVMHMTSVEQFYQDCRFGGWH
ncbi:hypothetical protein DAI22_03g294900 [Oryza sativa Japonica Group]|nr:hypothetical protein DAI22_03g294900 [Oryza sativa Japonica Group]